MSCDGDGPVVLQPGLDIRPRADEEDARALAWRLYGVEAAQVRMLNSYDDKNFFIQERDDAKVKSIWRHGYVLKIQNSLDSKNTDIVDAQNSIMLYLGSKGIVCPQPIKNKNGKYFSLEKLNTKDEQEDGKEHAVRLLTFQPGEILYNVPCTVSLLYDVGRYIGRLNLILKDFHHVAYECHKTTWMLEAVPQLKNFTFAVKDPERKSLAMRVINAFETEVLPHVPKLERGVLHGDFNEQNILVQESPQEKGKWQVIGVLDFGDTQISCYIFELAVSACYMMLQTTETDPLEAPGHVIAGYITKRKLTDQELSLLKKSISARLCQSLVLGAYSFLQDPTNQYLLTTAAKGWNLLKRLSETSEEVLLHKWQAIMKSYNE